MHGEGQCICPELARACTEAASHGGMQGVHGAGAVRPGYGEKLLCTDCLRVDGENGPVTGSVRIRLRAELHLQEGGPGDSLGEQVSCIGHR